MRVPLRDRFRILRENLASLCIRRTDKCVIAFIESPFCLENGTSNQCGTKCYMDETSGNKYDITVLQDPIVAKKFAGLFTSTW